MTTERLFLDSAVDTLTKSMSRIEVCLDQLTGEQIWARGHENENAPGNLALHLEGNVRQWILTSLSGAPAVRDRDAEFAARRGESGPALAAKLKATVDLACDVIRGLSEEALHKRYLIQGYEVSGVDVVLHVVEHFSYHTGQIIFATKHVKGEDLGFYRHLSSTEEKIGGTQPAAPPDKTKP